MRHAILSILLMTSLLPTWAQDDAEYRMEIGGGLGMMGYLGDFNENLTKDLQPMGTLQARYLLNAYSGWKLTAAYGKMKGSSRDVKTYYPDYADAPYEFSNGLVDVSLTFEQNLIPYGTGREYLGAKPLAPFVFGGLSATFVNNGGKDKSSHFTASLPIGVGVKYKVGDRLNLAVECAMHFSLSDKLDGVKDPYYVQSSGTFKNTDCYSTLSLTLTYSFWERCRVCHNQDED